MLRFALKILLALSLLTQGSFAAFASGVAHAHAHCQHGMQRDAHAKTPCCPDCDTATDISGCPTCSGVAMLTESPHASVRIEPVRLCVWHGAVPLLHGHTLPPTRPPIA
jgi:hypothetical protein